MKTKGKGERMREEIKLLSSLMIEIKNSCVE